MALLGSYLGLLAASRARDLVHLGQRLRWQLLAAVSIGGTGIWPMHFLAMIGFTVPGSVIKYELVPTVVSAGIAVGAVGVGILVVGFGRLRWWKLLLAGVFTGLGVAGMHYTGMAAMRLDGTLSYDPVLFGLSLVIAVVAATVALWFTAALRGLLAITIGAVVMGFAVCGMHYTGMAALRVTVAAGGSPVGGTPVTTFLLPILFAVAAASAAMLYAVLSAPSAADQRAYELIKQHTAVR